MTVGTLKKVLENVSDDAVVYLSNPNHFGSDPQLVHLEVGVRYMVSTNEEVWFETYGDENIAEEVKAISDYCMEHAVSDADFVRELIEPDGHGYTWLDLEHNLPHDQYEWIRETAYNNGLI